MGPDYAHAEARKSPALDGKVERDSEGKEVRYPVMLSAMEKLVARKVCLAFKVGGDIAATSRSAPPTRHKPICRVPATANCLRLRSPPRQRALVRV